MKMDRLIRALEEIKNEHPDDLRKASEHRDEISEIIPEFLEEVFITSGVQEIEKRIQESRKIDLPAINAALDVIENEKPQVTNFTFGDQSTRTVDPNKELADLRSALEPISNHGSKWSPMETALRLEMWFDPHITELLMCFPSDSAVYGKVAALVEEKLKLLDRNTILNLWGQLKGQFGEDRLRSGFKSYDDILPKDFFKETTVVGIVSKYALWISSLKPKTILRMSSEGFNTYPAGLPGVAKILSIRKRINQITNMDVLLIRAVSTVAAIYHELTFKGIDELARSVGGDPNGLVFSGEFFEAYKSKVQKNELQKPTVVTLVATMKRLREYCEEISVSRSQVSELLWRYKIGQEIVAPERTQSISRGKPNELRLQKEISKFLIEHGVLSFGRTLGRSEIDLYTQDSMGGEDFAIEVKVFKKNPSEGMIRKNLVQLRSYMDDISQPRGILAIFNCSNDLIIAPRKWLGGRVWVMAINICDASPSKRTRSLEIMESSGTDSFILVENDSRKSKPKKNAKKPAKR